MFASVNALGRHLPRPVVKTDIFGDREVVDHYLANAHAMRSEAVACVGRAFVAWLRRIVGVAFRPSVNMPSHQA